MTADAQDCVEGEIRGHHGTNGYEETVETEVKGVKSRQAGIFISWGGGTNDEKNFEADGVEPMCCRAKKHAKTDRKTSY